MSKIDELEKIKDEVLNLVDSPLYKYRTENKYLPVIGEGDHDANIIFIGEAPGRNEAKSGRPFCGSAGKILDELLDSVKIDRKDIYITNIVKDRPQKNRDPLPEEIEIYGPFLDRQIKIIKPQVIVTLGRYAMNYIMKKYGLDLEIEPIGKAHGRVYKAQGIDIVALYHPCVAIYNRKTLNTLIDDIKILKNY